MKKNKKTVGKRMTLKRKIEESNSVSDLLRFGDDALYRGNEALAKHAFCRAIALASSGDNFAEIIEFLSVGREPDAEYDFFEICRVMARKAALVAAEKFKDQRRFFESAETDEDMENWESCDLKRVIDAVDEFIGSQTLIDKILDPDATNEDFDWEDA
ncbi:MAG: hypothetical protein QXH80_03205 [Candidatus Nanoarchaeia archaeon]